ncbi:MAG: sensor histidine kinase [Sphingobium sp.]
MEIKTIIPENEAERIAAVRRFDVLDTPPDGAFDRVTALAARRFGVPISIISVVDESRIWFKSHHGLPVEQIERAPGLCASAILANEPYLLPDASIDPRSLANPLVAGEFGLRFYAAVPLTTSDGYNLGTLCVIDQEPRTVDQSQIDDLKDLASVVMDQMELRLSARKAVAQAQLMAKEIDHRVMNSLQFVSGLLTMQSRSPELGEAAIHIKMAANRVAAVAQVHRHFISDEAEETSCIDFVRRLCADLASILERPIDVKGDDAKVPTTWIQPIGLLVNELVTNAAKHGAGRIQVNYSKAEDGHRISVCDEGDGLPIDFDPSAPSKSLGMRVITSLAQQLQGQITASNRQDGNGSCFEVAFVGPLLFGREAGLYLGPAYAASLDHIFKRIFYNRPTLAVDHFSDLIC